MTFDQILHYAQHYLSGYIEEVIWLSLENWAYNGVFQARWISTCKSLLSVKGIN